MSIFMNPESKGKLMSFIISKTLKGSDSSKPEESIKKPSFDIGSEEEEDMEDMSGSLFAAEDIMDAIKKSDAKAFNQSLTDWFNMRPAEASESYSDKEES
jgi:hypothetical protein